MAALEYQRKILYVSHYTWQYIKGGEGFLVEEVINCKALISFHEIHWTLHQAAISEPLEVMTVLVD